MASAQSRQPSTYGSGVRGSPVMPHLQLLPYGFLHLGRERFTTTLRRVVQLRRAATFLAGRAVHAAHTRPYLIGVRHHSPAITAAAEGSSACPCSNAHSATSSGYRLSM